MEVESFGKNALVGSPGTRRGANHVSAPYIPAIDGLRALAVIAVLLCHAKLSTLFSGGFIGVDVFFVISGFVVTRSISKDQRFGVFSMPLFYARRFKRLVPALYVVMAATLAFGLMFCFPDTNYDILKNIGFVAVFYSNIYLSKQTGYFDQAAQNQPLLHTWSLSVEEQFYLVLPLLLVVSAKVRPSSRIAILAAAAACSLVYSQYAMTHAVPGAYYVFQARAFEFLTGVIVSLLALKEQKEPWNSLHEVACLAGLSAIVAAIVMFEAQTPMPGLYALLPCVGAALVVLGVGSRAARWMLGNRAMVYIGQISYALYLWHWPLLFALRRFHLNSGPWMAGGLAMSAFFAIFTHDFIEEPLRRLKWGNSKTVALLWILPVCILSMLIVLAKKTDNFVRFYSNSVQQDYASAGHSVFKLPHADRCWNKIAVTSETECTVGDRTSANKAVFLGDSHAYHLITFMDQLGRDHHIAIHDMTLSMCAPLVTSPAKAGDPAFQETRDGCVAHNRAVFAYLRVHPEIRTVFLAAVWQIYSNAGTGRNVNPTVHGFMPGEIDRELAETVKQMQALGKRVELFDDIPILPDSLESCVSDRLYLPNMARADCSYPETFEKERHEVAAHILDGVQSRLSNVGIIHTFDVPCRDGRCYPEIKGVPLYHHNDAGHLGAGGSAVYYGAYKEKHPDELNQYLDDQYPGVDPAKTRLD